MYEYYSAIKRKKILSFTIAWLDLEGVKCKGRQVLYDLTYLWNLKVQTKMKKNPNP